MSEIIHSRNIAEHLSALASLLEAEAVKAGVLGLHVERNLRGEAHRVRALADRLWESDSIIEMPMEKGRTTVPETDRGARGRRGGGGQVKLVSG